MIPPNEHYLAQSAAFRLALRQCNAAIAVARPEHLFVLRERRDRLQADRMTQLRTGTVGRVLAQALIGCSATLRARAAMAVRAVPVLAANAA